MYLVPVWICIAPRCSCSCTATAKAGLREPGQPRAVESVESVELAVAVAMVTGAVLTLIAVPN